MNSHPLNTNNQKNLPGGNQQDWREQPQQDWQEQPQQDWREQPQQDWQEQPQQDWREQPQQDWREQLQQDWREQPQQDWQEQPQQDWQEQPQQDWQEQPQQDWREQPQQDSLQEMYPGSPFPGTSSTVRKTFHMDKGTTISASIAALLLIGGGILSYTFYDKGEKLLKRTSYLKSDISALADETALLQKKYEPVKQTAEAIAQTSREAEQLQTSLESKKKEIEKIRQEHSPTLSRLNTIQQSINYREKEKKSRHNQKEALVKEISGLKEKIASLTTSSGPQPPLGEEQPGREINPASLQIDQKLFNQGTAYLMARQTGNIHYLSNIFALRCNYQYANGKDTDNAYIMNDIQKFWIKWPLRSYRLLKVAYLRNAIELVYFYECTNHQGRRIRGYTKEMWKTSPSGQIIHWNEVINPKEAPDVTPGYRTLQANH